MDMTKKIAVLLIALGVSGCAGMRVPDYNQIKTNPHYAECRENAVEVYKNNGYSKLANTVILGMNDRKAQAIVSGCVVAMDKSSIEEIKTDLNKKATTYGIIGGACYDSTCKIDNEQELKAYILGSYYASAKKFPGEMKAEF
ncbi:TPA: hypothetical protein QCH81_002197 [Enterobacter bugandensis]|nr:hypothetical protein [Enterobacter bugandensis]